MTLCEFNTLPYKQQLAAVFDTSTFLARRWENEEAINLYHLPGGVFVEIYFDTHLNQIVDLRSFTNATPLENYTHNIELPKDL